MFEIDDVSYLKLGVDLEHSVMCIKKSCLDQNYFSTPVGSVEDPAGYRQLITGLYETNE